MRVRTATANDAGGISDVARRTFTATFGHSFTPKELAFQLATTRSAEYFTAALRTDTILVAVATSNRNGRPTHDRITASALLTERGRIVGYIQLSDVRLEINGTQPIDQPGPQDQAVHALYIQPDFQGRGIGSMLMAAALDHPRLAAAPRVFLDVWDENTRAVRFYRKHGFEQVGTCDVVVQGKNVGQDLVMMRKRAHR